jgi:diguanylate cyclase (GGDEF)-like protein
LENAGNDSPQGEVSGAFLLGMLASFDRTHIIGPDDLPFLPDKVDPDHWYPYDYLLRIIDLIEKRTPSSSSILFWSGVRFIEIWYEQGPGRELVFNSLDWVQCHARGEGYNSAVRGNNVGWVRGLEINEPEGYALIENVMPLPADYLLGIYFGGFYLFDDMAYFNTHIASTTVSHSLPFPRTVIELTFKPSNHALDHPEPDAEPAAETEQRDLLTLKAEEAIWRYRHEANVSRLLKAHNNSILDISDLAFRELKAAKDALEQANRQLAEEIRTDPLTRLNNKRFFNEESLRLLNLTHRYNFSLCAMIIDVDYFKRYNDRYGHLAGDSALEAVAACIRENVSRKNDLAARFGGEEFVCLIVDSDEHGVRTIADRIASSLADRRIIHEGSDVSPYLTISVGSALQQDAPDRIECLLAHADEALYQAKAQGRARHIHSTRDDGD